MKKLALLFAIVFMLVFSNVFLLNADSSNLPGNDILSNGNGASDQTYRIKVLDVNGNDHTSEFLKFRSEGNIENYGQLSQYVLKNHVTIITYHDNPVTKKNAISPNALSRSETVGVMTNYQAYSREISTYYLAGIIKVTGTIYYNPNTDEVTEVATPILNISFNDKEPPSLATTPANAYTKSDIRNGKAYFYGSCDIVGYPTAGLDALYQVYHFGNVSVDYLLKPGDGIVYK